MNEKDREYIRKAQENLVFKCRIEVEGRYFKGVVKYDGKKFTGLGLDSDAVRVSLLRQLWDWEKSGNLRERRLDHQFKNEAEELEYVKNNKAG